MTRYHNSIKTKKYVVPYLPLLKVEEKGAGGSGYFSPAAVPSSSSGIRCSSITNHGRRVASHDSSLFNADVSITLQWIRRHSGSSTKFLSVQSMGLFDPTCRAQGAVSNWKQFFAPPFLSSLGNKANLYCPTTSRFIPPLTIASEGKIV